MNVVCKSGNKVGGQGSSLLVGGINSNAVYAHTLTAVNEETDNRTEVARVHGIPSHAGDEAASREVGRACPEANAEACSTLRRAEHARIHM